MMYQVLSARYLRGFSGRDHLLRDGDFVPAVGSFHGSFEAAKKAVKACSTHDSPIAAVIATIDVTADNPEPLDITHAERMILSHRAACCGAVQQVRI